MSKKLYEEDTIQDIADAVREKNGQSSSYKPAQLPDAIRNLKSGGKLFEFKIPSTWLSAGVNEQRFLVRAGSDDLTKKVVVYPTKSNATIYLGDGQSWTSGYFYGTEIDERGTHTHTYAAAGDYEITGDVAVLPVGVAYMTGCGQAGASVLACLNPQFYRTESYSTVAAYTRSAIDEDALEKMVSPVLKFPNVELILIGSTVKTIYWSSLLFCKIVYVPDNMVNSYKSATNFAAYSDYILPFSQCPYL